MTPVEKAHVEEIARIAYFTLGALATSREIREDNVQRQMVSELIDAVSHHCEALGVLPTSEPPSDLFVALTRPRGDESIDEVLKKDP